MKNTRSLFALWLLLFFHQMPAKTAPESHKNWSDSTFWAFPAELPHGEEILSSLPPETDDVRDEGGPLADEIQAIQKARGVLAALKKSGRFLEKLTGGDLAELPVGVQKQIGNVVYTMGIESVRLYPTYAEADIFLEIDLPEEREDPVFAATGVRFTRAGGLTGDFRLSLLGNFPIDIRGGKSRIVLKKSLKPGEGTSAVVDCDGFKSLTLDGYIVFSREWLKPVAPDGTIAPSGRVKGDFFFQSESWDLVVALSDFTPFALAGLEDVHWRTQQIILDFSELQNLDSFHLPENYPSPFLTATGLSPLWKGIYVQQLSVTLPPQFSPPDQPPLTVEAQDMVIDDQGFTGRLGVYHPLPLDKGNLNGWAFSVDTLIVGVTAMQFEELRFAGMVNLPLLSKTKTRNAGRIRMEDCVGYSAVILPGNEYLFSIDAVAGYYADLWKAKIQIEPNSSIDIRYTDRRFLATATLNGSIEIGEKFGTGIEFGLSEIRFEGLQLSNQAPYFQAGYWQLPEAIQARFGPFELGLNDIGLYEGSEPESAELRMAAWIGLAGDNLDLTALGGFRINGRLVYSEGRQRWVNESFSVDSILVAASTESWGVGARLDFYRNDPVYGSGFYGRGELWFQVLGGEEKGLSAAVQFGAKPEEGAGFRYFFCDVMARPDLTIAAGLKLKGIGGGVFYRMRRAGDLGVIAAQHQCPWTLGASLSGIPYLPDKNQGIAVKANAVVAASGEDTWSVNGTFEIAFYAGGGLNYVSIYGNATAFGPINWDNNPEAAQSTGVAIFVNMYYHRSAEYQGFKATADVFVNIKNRIKGISPHDQDIAGYAGGLDLEFSNLGWHINLGTPDAPLAVGMQIPLIGQAGISAYLDIGDRIPPMPDLPDYIQAITGAGNLMRNESLYATGAGFAFGASMNLNTGKRKVLGLFYYELGIGLGFDLMLQNYGQAVCADNSEKIGINGWYASGQAWALFEGEVGIEVNLAFVKGEFPILHAAAAVVLQCKGPNPFWAKGYVGGKYHILNGLVKGSFKIGVTIGQECILTSGEEDPFANLNLIRDLQPAEPSTGVSPAVQPTATFALPVDQPFEVNGETYRLQIAETQLNAGDRRLSSRALYEPGDNFMTLLPDDMLPGNSDIRFFLRVALMKKSAGCAGFCDTVKTEMGIVNFTTDEGFAVIPEINVKAAYPFSGQFNFYREEYPQGYILLHAGQPDLFDSGDYQPVARFTETSGGIIEAPVAYDPAQKKVFYSIPASNLAPGKLYQLEILRRFLAPPETYNTALPGSDNGPEPPTETPAPDPADQVLYQAWFRSSDYATFGDKIEALGGLLLGGPGSLMALNRPLSALFHPVEPFDESELTGVGEMPPLLDLSCRADVPWFQNHRFQDLVYDHFPVSAPQYPVPNTWRDQTLGEPPVEAVALVQNTSGLTIRESDFLQQSVPVYSGRADTLVFVFPNLVLTDYLRYQSAVDSFFRAWANQAIAASPELSPEELQQLDQNGDNSISESEWINHFLERCTGSCADCIQGGAEFGCPIPGYFADLYRADPLEMGSVIGQYFLLTVRYQLPGVPVISSIHTLRLTKN